MAWAGLAGYRMTEVGFSPGVGAIRMTGFIEDQAVDFDIEMGLFLHLPHDAFLFAFMGFQPTAGDHPVFDSRGVLLMTDQEDPMVFDDRALVSRVSCQGWALSCFLMVY